MVRGLADEDILDALIGDERTLQEMVMFIARKEKAKMERGTVSHENNDVSAVKSPAAQPGIPTTCSHCAGKTHDPAN